MPDSTALQAVVWIKADASNPSGECVELAVLEHGETIAMRNSRDPHGPALLFDAEVICSLTDAAQSGALDWLYEHSRFEQVDSGTLIRGGGGESGPG